MIKHNLRYKIKGERQNLYSFIFSKKKNERSPVHAEKKTKSGINRL